MAFNYVDEEMLRELVASVIQSKNEYAAVIWSPYKKTYKKIRNDTEPQLNRCRVSRSCMRRDCIRYHVPARILLLFYHLIVLSMVYVNVKKELRRVMRRC